MFKNIYKDRRVLVTGHTGFKGSWLSAWLLNLGAKVAGYSLGIPSKPSHFESLSIINKIEHFTGDVRDGKALQKVLNQFRPEIVFHLAAQSLVRESYKNPVLTIETNTIGTLNLLDCLRGSSSIAAAVLITSDKCYENVEWLWGYRENDRLGGKDLYSASKACAEIISKAYMESFFGKNRPHIATTRAGNVIGGGDWANDRVIPDCIRAWSKGEPVIIRNPSATRPWQHVLEPLSGYLALGQELFEGNLNVKNQSFNFGPQTQVNESVADLITEIARLWPDAKLELQQQTNSAKLESTLLKLNCDKALKILKWNAILDFEETASMTRKWYQTFYNQGPTVIPKTTSAQIKEYSEKATKDKLSWTQ
jgi:CDP-glucose 4,6-dehydratase